MVVSLGLALAALRLGLALRRARAARRPPPAAARRRHLRLGKSAVACVLVGLVAGPISAVWLRGWEAFATFHAWVGLAAALGFAGAAVAGHRLESGRADARPAHAGLAAAAVLAGAVAAIAGFVLLP
jgi:hypothetical protein